MVTPPKIPVRTPTSPAPKLSLTKTIVTKELGKLTTTSVSPVLVRMLDKHKAFVGRSPPIVAQATSATHITAVLAPVPTALNPSTREFQSSAHWSHTGDADTASTNAATADIQRRKGDADATGANTATNAAAANTDMAGARSIARGKTTANAKAKMAPIDVEIIANVVADTATKAAAIEIPDIDRSPVSKATAPLIKAPVKQHLYPCAHNF